MGDGAIWGHNRHLPGNAVWLVGEWRATGERQYYLSNLPPGTSLRPLAGAIKARWVCEQAHQQLTQEPGLSHFEGRSWTGLHRHALMTCIAFADLQHLRLVRHRRQTRRGEKTVLPARTAPLAKPAGRAPDPQRTALRAARPASPMPALQAMLQGAAHS